MLIIVPVRDVERRKQFQEALAPATRSQTPGRVHDFQEEFVDRKAGFQ
jgi:hypothetical protein